MKAKIIVGNESPGLAGGYLNLRRDEVPMKAKIIVGNESPGFAGGYLMAT